MFTDWLLISIGRKVRPLAGVDFLQMSDLFPILLAGENFQTEPLSVQITLLETVRLTSIDLLNEVGVQFGFSPCIEKGPRAYTAVFDPQTVSKWHGTGEPVLRLRVHMELDGRECHKDMPVVLAVGYVPGWEFNGPAVWRIRGYV